jgi:Fic family protein
MGSNALPIRFTDEKYATKSDVVKALGTSLVDSIWRNIVGYRLQSAKKLALKTIPQVPFYVTYTQPIAQRINDFQVKLAHFMLAFSQVTPGSQLQIEVERYAKLNILRDAAAIEGVKISDLSLKAMLNGTYFENNKAHAPILGYRDALDAFQSAPVNEDLLATYYGELMGEEELTSFYRISDPDGGNMYHTVVIGRDYQYAPYSEIPDLMEDFFAFLNNDVSEPIVHAVTAIYYLDYIKPFEAHNQLCGCLLAKSIFEEANVGLIARLLPLERVFVPTDRLKTLCLETQRSADMTYIVLYALDILEPALEDLINEIKRAQARILEAERTPVTPSDVTPKAPITQAVEDDIPLEDVRLENRPSSPAEPLPEVLKPAPAPAPKEEPRPVFVEQPKPQPAPIPVEVKPQPAPAPVAPKPVEPPYVAPQASYISEPVASAPAAPAYSAPSSMYQEKPAPAPAPTPAPAPAPVISEKPVSVAPAPILAPTPKPEPAKVVAKPAPEPLKKAPVVPAKPMTQTSDEIALSTLPTSNLSDKELKEFARYIVETNPRIRKPQALFFASHSSLGRYYTIQDYKRTIRCAYETARTSMDNLAAEGFYQKLQIKNKFVYTPIKQGEKQ